MNKLDSMYADMSEKIVESTNAIVRAANRIDEVRAATASDEFMPVEVAVIIAEDLMPMVATMLRATTIAVIIATLDNFRREFPDPSTFADRCRDFACEIGAEHARNVGKVENKVDRCILDHAHHLQLLVIQAAMSDLKGHVVGTPENNTT
jgi:cellobiose-specific phosphotransferase system component IIA